MSPKKRAEPKKQPEQNAALAMSEPLWNRVAVTAAERVFTSEDGPLPDLQAFGAYLRTLRYSRGVALADVAEAAGVPFEQVVLVEQGLLPPPAFGPQVWVQLLRVLEGAGPLEVPTATRAPKPRVKQAPAGPVATGQQEERVTVPSTAAGDRKGGPAIGVARIKVIGVGGGGSNAVSRMYRQRVPGVEYAVVNTDSQHLLHIDVPVKLRIGDELTRGLGVGGNPEIGRQAALESRERLDELVADADMVFIACGMGGGTGTGAAPVVAELAKAAGALTIAAVTKPFNFEGRRRMRQAEDGIEHMRQHVDTLLIIPNDRLSAMDGGEITAENAFRLADDVLRQGVQSITELITVPGEINLDFADVKTVMRGAGPAWMAIGYGRGPDRAVDAAKAALESPMLDMAVEGATRVLLNITGGADVTLHEVHRAADYVSRMVDPEANIIFGIVTDARLDDEIRVTVIATGIRNNEDLFNEAVAQMDADAVTETDETPEQPPTAAEEATVVEDKPAGKQGFWQRFGLGRRKPGE